MSRRRVDGLRRQGCLGMNVGGYQIDGVRVWVGF